jgi:hypothetical protein
MMNTAANALENQMRKGKEGADIPTDIANPAIDPKRYADPSGERMLALTWEGANNVQLSESNSS